MPDKRPDRRAAAAPPGSAARQRAVAATEQEIATLTRRVHMNTAQLNPDLNYSAYTLLRYIQNAGGCRATDLAEHYGLDKSTLSRQLGTLIRHGLIVREVPGPDRRLQLLHTTASGRQRLERVSQRMNAALEQRVQGWSDADLDTLAHLLARYNAAPVATDTDSD